MTTITRPSPRQQAHPRPLDVAMVITIDGQSYDVSPIAPGPDNVRAYRLVKRAADATVYDLAQTAAGLVECDCPSYEYTFRGNGLATCKHGRALIMCGLVDYPDLPGPIAPALDAYNDRREAEAGPAFVHVPDEFDEAEVPGETPADPVDPRTWSPDLDADDDDGPDLDEGDDGSAGWEDPGDGDPDDEWQDAWRWWTTTPTRTGALTMVEMVLRQASLYRAWGTDLGDLLADQMEETAGRMWALSATTPDGYRDRLDAMRDAAGR